MSTFPGSGHFRAQDHFLGVGASDNEATDQRLVTRPNSETGGNIKRLSWGVGGGLGEAVGDGDGVGVAPATFTVLGVVKV